MRGLFVTATDTGVGKTVVAGAIIAALRARGERVAAFKPVVTGLDEPAEPGWPRDHELLAAAAGTRPEAVAPSEFGPPVSPHLAAELAGVELEPRRDGRGRERGGGRRRRERADRRGRGRAARPAHPRGQRARSRGRARLPAGRSRPPGPRDDQPHAPDARGRPRGGPHGRGRRDDALAGAAERDGAVEPRDGRPAGRGRRGHAAAPARRLARVAGGRRRDAAALRVARGPRIRARALADFGP